MDAAHRRKTITHILEEAKAPVSAAALAREFSVSRQIIVGDVALLRAAGLDIAATPRGYVLPKETTGLVRTVACVHPGEAMARELEIMVDQGCQVMDVVVGNTRCTASLRDSCVWLPGMMCRSLSVWFLSGRPDRCQI